MSTQSKIIRDAPSGSGLYLGAPKGKVPAEVRKNILYNMKMTREVDDRIGLGEGDEVPIGIAVGQLVRLLAQQ